MKDDNKSRTAEQKTSYTPGKGAGSNEQRHDQSRKSNESSVQTPGKDKSKDDKGYK